MTPIAIGLGVGLPFGGGVQSYIQRTLATTPFAYWPLNETAGLTANCLVNPAQNGAFSGCTLGQTGIGDGGTSVLLDGAASYIDIYSAALNTAFNGAEGSAMIWGRVANAGVWTDGIGRRLLHLVVDVPNRISIAKSTANNLIEIHYVAGGVTKAINVNCSSIDFICLLLTWSAANDRFRVYYQGIQAGATLNALGVWAGNLFANECLIGARTKVGNNVFSGTEAHCALWGRELTPAEGSDLFF